MATEEVRHYQIGTKYRVVIEQAASTKGILGWKVEVNSDSKSEVIGDAHWLMAEVQKLTPSMPILEKKGE